MPSSQPDLRCYHHPDREATGQCDRCGDYLCEECLKEYMHTPLCQTCLTSIRQPWGSGRSRTVVWFWVLVWMCILLFVAGGIRMLALLFF